MKKHLCTICGLMTIIGLLVSGCTSDLSNNIDSSSIQEQSISENSMDGIDSSTSCESIQTLKDDTELLDGCIKLFENIQMGSWLSEPMDSVDEFLAEEQNKPILKIIIYNYLSGYYDEEQQILEENDAPCFPRELCAQATEQLLGISLEKIFSQDSGAEFPDEMIEMPTGYSGTMVSGEVDRDKSVVDGKNIQLNISIYWNEYGEAPQKIAERIYKFVYSEDNDICQYKLVCIT